MIQFFRKGLLVIFVIFTQTIVFCQEVKFTREIKVTEPRIYGDDVKKIQKRLISLGYSELGDPDGWYGPLSETAIKNFQFESDIYPSGKVDKETWDQLFSGNIIICAYSVYNNKNTPSYDLTGKNEDFWDGMFWNGSYRGKILTVNGERQFFLFNQFTQDDIWEYPIKFKVIIPDSLNRKDFSKSLFVKIYQDKYIYENKKKYTIGEECVIYNKEFSWDYKDINVYSFILPKEFYYNKEYVELGCFPLYIKILINETIVAEDIIGFFCGE